MSMIDFILAMSILQPKEYSLLSSSHSTLGDSVSGVQCIFGSSIQGQILSRRLTLTIFAALAVFAVNTGIQNISKTAAGEISQAKQLL